MGEVVVLEVTPHAEEAKAVPWGVMAKRRVSIEALYYLLCLAPKLDFDGDQRHRLSAILCDTLDREDSETAGHNKAFSRSRINQLWAMAVAQETRLDYVAK